MPVINLDYPDLISLSTITKKEIIEYIPMIGAGIEKINIDSIDVEFFPNRPDLYSVEGISRALKTFSEVHKGLYIYNIKQNNDKYIVNVNENVNKIRPLIVCSIIKQLLLTKKIIKTLTNLVEDLHWALGRNKKKVSIHLHDLDRIKFPLSYEIINPNIHFMEFNNIFMPIKDILNNKDCIKYKKIIFNNSNEFTVLIDDQEQIISISALASSSKTEVSENTKNILIEVTGTNREVECVLNIISAALIDRNGICETVTIYNNKIKNEYPLMKPIETIIDIDEIELILGIKLTKNEIIKSLNKMGHNSKITIKNDEHESLFVESPAYRSDILHVRDIIEDIAIGYGYEKMNTKKSNLYTIGEETEFNKKKKKLFEILIGLGFTQVIGFTLTSEKVEFQKMNRTKTNQTTILLNPINEEQTIMRTSLLPGLLEMLSLNRHYELPQNIFEIGEVLIDMKKNQKLCFVSINSTINFTDILEFNDALFRELNIIYYLKESEDAAFINGRRAEIYVLNNKIGTCGELNPDVINNFELTYPIIGLEIDLSTLFNL